MTESVRQCHVSSRSHRYLKLKRQIWDQFWTLLIRALWTELRLRFYFSSEQTSVPPRVTRADESGSSCRVGECAFKWFLTHWRSIMPELWKSLRWAASAYAHYLWEHAASWLHFTKTGTQGQREWEWEMCMLTPSDEAWLQLFIRYSFVCVRVCMCVCLLSILSSPDFKHWLPPLETDSNTSHCFLLWQLVNCNSLAWLAHCYPYGNRFIGLDCEVLFISSLVLSAAIHTHIESQLLNIIITVCLLACSLTRPGIISCSLLIFYAEVTLRWVACMLALMPLHSLDCVSGDEHECQ